MVKTEPISGEMRHGGVPDWQPLLDLVGEATTGWFMWMFDAELADGRILNAYKHVDTRRYVHIAPEGKTYLYVGDHSYERVPVLRALELVFFGWERCVTVDEPCVTIRACPSLWRPDGAQR